MRIASFNLQNLRLRRFEGRVRFDGARDDDVPEDTGSQATALDLADRRLTAAIVAHADADVICMQEVFDLATLNFFHDHLLRYTGTRPYPYRFCFPGNDGAGRNVALMSRRTVEEVISNPRLTAEDLELAVPRGIRPSARVFRRDCLLARVGQLTLFLCHFKSPWPNAKAAWLVRRLEALAVKRLIERRFEVDREVLWLIIGDLNEPHYEPKGMRAIEPLLSGFTVDLMERLPEAEQWSYYDRESAQYSRPDYLLASPALAKRWPDARPFLLREGLSREIERYRGPRLLDVGEHRPHASDHAALVLDLAGLQNGNLDEQRNRQR